MMVWCLPDARNACRQSPALISETGTESQFHPSIFKIGSQTRFMLIGGIDVSGSRHEGQNNHAALVIGKKDAINRIYNKIGMREIHMSRISKQQRRHVYDNLDFSNEIAVWCFHIGRQQIETDVKKYLRSRKNRRPNTNIRKSFDKYWLRLFKDDLESFARRLRMDPSEIVIQADADMCPTLQNWGITDEYKGKAYELSDAVAWFNQKGTSIKNCRIMDLRSEIKKACNKVY